MKAFLTTKDCSNATNYAGSKEIVSTLNVVGLKKGAMQEIVTVRWYMARSASASVMYCSVWVHSEECYISGSGKAGGYGYHKESAAFEEALTSAGVELYANRYGDQYGEEGRPKSYRCYIGGCGDRAVELACEALARALGYRKYELVRN